jgi:hypothetical protein
MAYKHLSIYHLSDMHTLNLKIEGDMEFQRWLNIKQNLEFLKSLELKLISCISTLQTIAS